MGNDIVLFGVTGMALVALIVQVIKTTGLRSKWFPLASLLAGFLVATLWELDQLYPTYVHPIAQVIVLGLVLGTGGSGLYSHINRNNGSSPSPARENGQLESPPPEAPTDGPV